MAGQFVLQIVGITEGKILSRPSIKLALNTVSDVFITKDNTRVLAYTPSMSCDTLADAGRSVLVAPCLDDSNLFPPEKRYTHAVFLSVYNDEEGNPETEQIIAINPKIAIELMESAIEKKLIAALQNVKQFKRNVPMKIENKIDSCFTFVGMCDDEIPFIMEVHNVPFAEYNHGQAQQAQAQEAQPVQAQPVQAQAQEAQQAEKLDYDSKVAYFPEKNNTNTIELLKVVRDLITIKSESNIRCMLGFVIERTDIERFEISKYNSEYRAVVKEAIDHGIDIIPLVISWTKEGIAFFVTDELPVVYPHL